MTISAKQAAEKCMNLGKQFQAVIDIGECLDRIGNLETAIAEAKVATTTADSDRFAAEAKRADVQEQVNQALKELQDSKNEAIKILADTNIARENLLAKARADRDETVQVAADDAANLIKNAKNRVSVLTSEADKLTEENGKLRESLTHLRYEMQVLRERLSA